MTKNEEYRAMFFTRLAQRTAENDSNEHHMADRVLSRCVEECGAAAVGMASRRFRTVQAAALEIAYAALRLWIIAERGLEPSSPYFMSYVNKGRDASYDTPYNTE